MKRNFEYENSRTAELLRAASRERVLYYPNPGNAGDSLIAAATYQIFSAYDISYDVDEFRGGIDPTAFNDRILIIGGGGNLIDLYSNVRNILNAAVGRAKQIILLPHTVRGNEELLRSLPNYVTIICREAISYQHCVKYCREAEVVLGHDMALFCDTQTILTNAEYARAGNARTQQNYAEHAQKRGLDNIPEQGPIKFCFRADREKTFDARSIPNNLDISDVFRYGCIERRAFIASYCVLKFLSGSERVFTDRLHVGIGSYLLNIPCELYDNSYGKNSSIFLHSLSRRTSSTQLALESPALLVARLRDEEIEQEEVVQC
jgi:exopolysaccharide biosynthesis predicted pyruvyltransferase EpsI